MRSVRCAEVFANLIFFALAPAIPTGIPSIQSPIQPRFGVAPTYVAHDFDQQRDRDVDVAVDTR
jgi:hypothetical protein